MNALDQVVRDIAAELAMDSVHIPTIAGVLKARLQPTWSELDALRREREEAAGELPVDVREMPVGSTLGKVVSANRLLINKCATMNGAVNELRNISTHFEMLVDKSIQEELGVRDDQPPHMRVLRLIDDYNKIRAKQNGTDEK